MRTSLDGGHRAEPRTPGPPGAGRGREDPPQGLGREHGPTERLPAREPAPGSLAPPVSPRPKPTPVSLGVAGSPRGGPTPRWTCFQTWVTLYLGKPFPKRSFLSSNVLNNSFF